MCTLCDASGMRCSVNSSSFFLSSSSSSFLSSLLPPAFSSPTLLSSLYPSLLLPSQVLLINFPSLGSFSAGENFKFIFREAKINDAILFFDECEAIFESRERGSHDVNMLLTEIER